MSEAQTLATRLAYATDAEVLELASTTLDESGQDRQALVIEAMKKRNIRP